jgi:site-specific DNA recombinase
VYLILRNKAYISVLEYNFRRRYGPVEPVTIPGFYPPIIDRDLFARVEEKIKLNSSNWQNSYAHRTNYLLSRLIICDACGQRYLGTSAKGGKFHYYCCGSYLKAGKKACAAPLLNKEKLETAVSAQIRREILSEDNVRRYIELVIKQAQNATQPRTPEAEAVIGALVDVDARLRRWEDALERGELTTEHAAQRIRELHVQRGQLLKRKTEVEKLCRARTKVIPIPTALMKTYIKELQGRLAAKQIGSKKEFLREIVKEIRIRGSEVVLTYRLPLQPRSQDSSGRTERFFTVLGLVGPPGFEPGPDQNAKSEKTFQKSK